MNVHATIDSLTFAGVFIDNEWQPSASGETLNMVAPAEGKPFAKIAAGNADDIDRAVAAARRAFEGDWGRLTAAERGRLLMKWAYAVGDNFDELAALEARDTGKPMKQARADITAAVRYFEYYAGCGDKLHGETIPYMDGFFVATERVPLGVTGHIVPWNYPAQIGSRNFAAPLAVGNAVVMKPSEDACLTLLRMAELARDVGFPPGAVNVVPGLGPVAGDALTRHPGVDHISFTGSPAVGTLVQKNAAENHVGVTLELGGKGPQVVFADVDLDAAVPTLVNAIVQNAGQTCSAGSRLVVERAGYDRIVGAVAERFATLRTGTPEMDLDLGPIISAKQKERIKQFAAGAATDGVPIIAEGAVADDVPDAGFFLAPRMYGPVPQTNALAQDEVFGPVLSVIPFEDEAEAVRIANGTDYGLVAAVWSADAKRAMRVARKVRAGQVYVNAYGAGGGIELPFGGFRKSGHGREKGFEALHHLTAVRTLVVKHD